METDHTPIDSTGTPPAHAPSHDGSHSSRGMWLMMLGCCFAIPLALIIGGVSAGGLAGAQPWLLAIGGVLAIALVIAHRATSGPRCERPETDVGRRR